MTYERTDDYYDLHVPGQEHYLADGLWSHNTGKSTGVAFFIHGASIAFPGLRVLVMRQNRVDLNESFMETFEEEVLDVHHILDCYVLCNGRKSKPNREQRRVYKYPPEKATGKHSLIVLGGMDQWERYRSTRWDIVWLVEATEFGSTDVEGMARALRPQRRRPGRGLVQGRKWPNPVLIMDTNPDGPEHHLRKRADRGTCFEVKTTIEDNPGFWDRVQNAPTPDGKQYLGRLGRSTSGHVQRRLLHHEWAGAVGSIFDMFQASTHVVHGAWEPKAGHVGDRIVFDPPHPLLGEYVDIASTLGGYDAGVRNSAAFQVWAFDVTGRSYLVHEVYEPQRSLDWWAAQVVEAFAIYNMRVIACDHDWHLINRLNDALHEANVAQFGPYRRETYTQAPTLTDTVMDQPTVRGSVSNGGRIRIATPAIKRSSPGQLGNIELLRRRMMPGADGVPKLMLLASALQGRRPEALDRDRAWGVREEIVRAVWRKHRDTAGAALPKDEIDPGCDDHGLDAAAYGHTWAIGRGVNKIKPDVERKRPKAGSWEEHEARYAGTNLVGPQAQPEQRRW